MKSAAAVRRLLAILLLAPAAAVAACTPASGYSFATAVTIAAPAATLTDFPQPFYTGGSGLSSLATALAANARADGYDIIFRTEDPPSTIAHRRVHWDDSTGHWFGYLGPLTRSTATTVCVNYGNAGATDTSAATPLAALEVVTAPNLFATDFTGNGHFPAEFGLPTRAAGPVGPVWELDETVPSYLTLTDSGSSGEIFSSTTFRMSILVNAAAATTESDPERLVWRNTTTTNQRHPIMIWGDTGGGNGTIGKQGVPSNTFGPLSGGSWHWITVVYDDAVADNSRAWVDGVLVDTDSPAFALSAPTGDITIGFSSASVAWSGSVGLFMMGLTTAGDSAAWQEAEALALLSPNSVFSLPASPMAPLMPIGSMRLLRLNVPDWVAVAATTCMDGEVQIGDACTADPGGADGEMGALSIMLGEIWQ